MNTFEIRCSRIAQALMLSLGVAGAARDQSDLPATGSRNTVTADPPVVRPQWQPCVAPLFSGLQFVNYNNGNGGNYQLLSTSPYHNAATDGTDLGADISTIVSETAGVY